MLLNHRSSTVQSSSPTSESSIYPSLQSPSLPTDPSTCSRHVPATELGDRNDPQLMNLLNHRSPTNPSMHSGDVPVTQSSGRNNSHLMFLTTGLYFGSSNTSTQSSPDRPIDGHCVNHNLPPHREIRGSDEIPQQYVYYSTHPDNTNMSQNCPTLTEFTTDSWYYFGSPNC